MSKYTQSVAMLKANLQRKHELEEDIRVTHQEVLRIQQEYQDMLEALEYIGALSDKNMNKVLDYITGVINNALNKVFPYDTRMIKLERSLYRNAYSHINLELIVDDGETRSLELQSGTGLQQIISFMYTLTLIEIRKERKLVCMDEWLSGVHESAKQIMGDIMQMFASHGFQFFVIEYALDSVGKIYLIEKKGKTSEVIEFQGTYTDDIIFASEDDQENNLYQPSRKIQEAY